MSETIQFRATRRQDCPAYLARQPSAASAAPAIVVIQEYWGLNPQIKKTADRFAAAGYRALVPDLYRGKVAATPRSTPHDGRPELPRRRRAGRPRCRSVPENKRRRRSDRRRFCMGGALTSSPRERPGDGRGRVLLRHAAGGRGGSGEDHDPDELPLREHRRLVHARQGEPTSRNRCERLEGGARPLSLRRAHAFMNEARPEVYDPEARSSRGNERHVSAQAPRLTLPGALNRCPSGLPRLGACRLFFSAKAAEAAKAAKRDGFALHVAGGVKGRFRRDRFTSPSVVKNPLQQKNRLFVVFRAGLGGVCAKSSAAGGEHVPDPARPAKSEDYRESMSACRASSRTASSES